MKPSQQICDFIRRREAFVANAYKPLPTDPVTIGYGNIYYEDGSKISLGDSISEEAAIELSDYWINKMAEELNQIVPDNCTQQQFDAVLDLCYNVGYQTICGSTTGVMFRNGEDISNRFELWTSSGGHFVQGLLNRRLMEKEIYLNGNYPN